MIWDLLQIDKADFISWDVIYFELSTEMNKKDN